MCTRDRYEVAYLPYAPIKDGFKVGDYEIWPYHRECESRIRERRGRDHLSKFLACYHERRFDRQRGGYDEPVEEIFVISPQDSSAQPCTLTQQQAEDIRSVAHILAFSAINEPCITKWTSDAFVLHTLTFQGGSESVRLYDTIYSDPAMVKFLKPHYLPKPLLKFEKTDLCDALGQAMRMRNDSCIRRVFRAMELFYHTATHSEMMTAESRLLSLVTSFEVLLNYRDKWRFADRIDRWLDNYHPAIETRSLLKDGQPSDVSHTKTGWWAFDLYNLRSAIVHGKQVDWCLEKYGNIWTRIEFGGILLRKLVKRVLKQKNLWPPESDQDILGDAILEADALDNVLSQKVSEFQERIRRSRNA
jgi:hypothetical protein